MKFYAADLFCGGGGFTTGLLEACNELGHELDLVAVNHWDAAIETHSLNHPQFRHICASIESLDPRNAVPGGYLDLLLAAPECTHHSSARGGKPINDQKRAPAWLILRWLEMLKVETLILENVPEFRTWGPLYPDDYAVEKLRSRPIPDKKGIHFEHFLQGIRNLGYTVEHQVLCAADYGAATTRKRLFIVARLGQKKITWPEITHTKTGESGTKWRAAREIIDFSIKSQSIFTRKRPLAPTTMNRIFHGLERQGLGPIIVTLRNHMNGQSVEHPLPTITAGGTHVGIAEPFLMHVTHGGRVHSIDDPVKTITTARRGEIALCESMLIQQQSGGVARTLSNPAPTVAAKGAIGLADAYLIEYHSEKSKDETPRTRTLDEPMATLDCSNRFALAEPVLVPMYSEREGQALRTHSIDEPTPTIPATGGGKFGLAEAFIVPHRHWNGGNVDSVERPLRTITAAAGRNFGLVQPVVQTKDGRTYLLDIRFRMLQPHELSAAMDFPADYVFSGKKTRRGIVRKEDIIRQIGNAVDVKQSRALCHTAIVAMVGKRRKRAA